MKCVLENRVLLITLLQKNVNLLQRNMVSLFFLLRCFQVQVTAIAFDIFSM